VKSLKDSFRELAEKNKAKLAKISEEDLKEKPEGIRQAILLLKALSEEKSFEDALKIAGIQGGQA
jgi:hypothetical protein